MGDRKGPDGEVGGEPEEAEPQKPRGPPLTNAGAAT